jgi:hypothetical protein
LSQHKKEKYAVNAQVQSAIKVGEESEVATNIQLYEIEQMSFTIKLILQNESAFITALLG